jgi:hypothetical protein
MKKTVLAVGVMLVLTGCSNTMLEKEQTEKEICVYERKYDFWGRQKGSDILIACEDRTGP